MLTRSGSNASCHGPLLQGLLHVSRFIDQKDERIPGAILSFLLITTIAFFKSVLLVDQITVIGNEICV